MEPCFIIVYSYPTSWAYTRNHINTYIHTIKLVCSTKIPRRGLRNISPEKVIYTACCCSASNLAIHAFHPPLLADRLHAVHEIFKLCFQSYSWLLILHIVNQNHHQNILYVLLHSDPCKIFVFLKPFCSKDHIYVVFMVRVKRNLRHRHTCLTCRFQETSESSSYLQKKQ